MTTYHVSVSREEGWYVGRVLERAGVTTQGRTLDELVTMVRDAVLLMWQEDDVQLELIVPGESSGVIRRKPKAAARPASGKSRVRSAVAKIGS